MTSHLFTHSSSDLCNPLGSQAQNWYGLLATVSIYDQHNTTIHNTTITLVEFGIIEPLFCGWPSQTWISKLSIPLPGCLMWLRVYHQWWRAVTVVSADLLCLLTIFKQSASAFRCCRGTEKDIQSKVDFRIRFSSALCFRPRTSFIVSLLSNMQTAITFLSHTELIDMLCSTLLSYVDMLIHSWYYARHPRGSTPPGNEAYVEGNYNYAFRSI